MQHEVAGAVVVATDVAALVARRTSAAETDRQDRRRSTARARLVADVDDDRSRAAPRRSRARAVRRRCARTRSGDARIAPGATRARAGSSRRPAQPSAFASGWRVAVVDDCVTSGRRQRFAASAMRRPKPSAVRRSPSCERSARRRLRHEAEVAAEPVRVVGFGARRRAYVGGRPRPTQTMPCCAANTASCVSVPSLSPLGAAECVKPAASLSRQPCSAQIAVVPSMNVLERGRRAAHVRRAAEDDRIGAREHTVIDLVDAIITSAVSAARDRFSRAPRCGRSPSDRRRRVTRIARRSTARRHPSPPRRGRPACRARARSSDALRRSSSTRLSVDAIALSIAAMSPGKISRSRPAATSSVGSVIRATFATRSAFETSPTTSTATRAACTYARVRARRSSSDRGAR